MKKVGPSTLIMKSGLRIRNSGLEIILVILLCVFFFGILKKKDRIGLGQRRLDL